ncbi:hypothetical protein N656DRAFT_778543 [Canariomyces notabilis]|uniref:Heterokaryon incompatibility domain-containing protein n=1 Tax=Canariomyces notabilis TaxID=2074819 RepID=A0AAN6TEN8_9PEZI|nr:hypothetical protein N656DRAFT_778543 [Canariomyces arenarius]
MKSSGFSSCIPKTIAETMENASKPNSWRNPRTDPKVLFGPFVNSPATQMFLESFKTGFVRWCVSALIDRFLTTPYKLEAVLVLFYGKLFGRDKNLTISQSFLTIAQASFIFIPWVWLFDFSQGREARDYCTVLSLIFGGVHRPIVSYMAFRNTDEENLGDFVKGVVPTASFIAIDIVFLVLRAVWRHFRFMFGFITAGTVIWWSLGAVSGVLPAFDPRQIVRRGIWGLSSGAARLGFRIYDIVVGGTRNANSAIEAWEMRRAASKMSALPEYAYSPLDAANHEFRILRLRRRTLRAELVCDFIQVPVDEAPPFEAISYAWGGEQLTEAIMVDGKRLTVTPTVLKLLWYRRSFFSEAYLWIDALCIDQRNQVEKEDQIPLMRDIYKRASRTLVWLAHPCDAPRAHKARGLSMNIISLGTRMESGALSADQVLYMLSSDSGMPTLASLLSRTFFERLWVVQEIALAKKVHVLYGDITVEWDNLATVAKFLGDPRLMGSLRGGDGSLKGVDEWPLRMEEMMRAIRNVANIVSINMLRRAQVYDMLLLSLSQAMAYALSNFRTTIPHDRIFGALSLVSDGAVLVGRPNYEEPVRDLYTRVARRIIDCDSSFSVLELAGTGYGKRIDGLPSWVPDLTRGNQGKRVSLSASSFFRNRRVSPNSVPADSSLDYNGSFTLDMELRIEGIVFDAISHIQDATCMSLALYSDFGLSDDTADDFIDQLCNWYEEARALASNDSKTRSLYGSRLQAEFFNALMSCAAYSNSVGSGLTVDLLENALQAAKQSYQDPSFNYSLHLKKLQSERGLSEAEVHALLSGFNQVLSAMGESAGGKRFATLASGRMALVPPGSRPGDTICYIRDTSVPFVIRPAAGKGYYELVGSCYVHGVEDECTKDEGWEGMTLV